MISGKIIPAIATTTAAITGFIGVEMYKYIINASLESYRAASINLASNVFCVENLPDPQYRKSGLDQQTYMQVVAIPEKHTCWDTVVIDKPGLTLQQFIDEFAEGAEQHKCCKRGGIKGERHAGDTCGSLLIRCCSLLCSARFFLFFVSAPRLRDRHSDSHQRLELWQGSVQLDGLVRRQQEGLGGQAPGHARRRPLDGDRRAIFPADRKYLLFDCSVEDDSGNPGIVPTIRYNFRQ